MEFTRSLKNEAYERLLLKPVVSKSVLLDKLSSGSNWYMVFVSQFTVSFANSTLITIDTAIIRSSLLVVFCKKGFSYEIFKIHKKAPALESRF